MLEKIKKKTKLSAHGIKIITLAACSAFTITVLALTIAALNKVVLGSQEQGYDYLFISVCMFFAVICVGMAKFVRFFIFKSKKEKIRVSVLLAYCGTIAFLFLFGYLYLPLYVIAAILYVLSIALSRIFKIFVEKKKLLVFNIIGIVFSVLVSLFFANAAMMSRYDFAIIFAALLMSFNALMEAGIIAFSQMQFRALFKIIRKTYAVEIIFGLLTLMVAISLVLPLFEETITNVWDALWYSFAVVTTIGFGDFAAVSGVGRFLTVILGIFGIIVVAVITSIIVNFYNETAGNKKEETKETEEEVPEQIEENKQEENDKE